VVARQAGALLATLIETSRAEPQLQDPFNDRTVFDQLRIDPYYRTVAARHADVRAAIADLIADSWKIQTALVHGDYSPKNVLVRHGQLVLLDYEVIHFGDPAFDVGFSLTHLLSKAHHLPPYRQRFVVAAHQYWRIYAEAIRGPDWATPEYEARAVRHTLACLLARVAGRSPLEYLNREEQDRQCTAVIALMQAPPAHIPDLIERFMTETSRGGNV
jgi:aminoglycoside phosphotransferase (APT) family kinase protein